MTHRRLSPERKRLYAGKRGPNGRPLCRRCGREVLPPRRTFCGVACVHEWKLRNDPGYLREKVWERDRGVCALCGRQCRRGEWEADHIVPLADGGDSTLDNVRTLCRECHRRVTAEWRRARRSRVGDAA